MGRLLVGWNLLPAALGSSTLLKRQDIQNLAQSCKCHTTSSVVGTGKANIWSLSRVFTRLSLPPDESWISSRRTWIFTTLMLHKKTHTNTLSLSQSVFINSKKQLYRSNDSQLVLIVLYIIGSFIHLFPRLEVWCRPVRYSDCTVERWDLETCTAVP